MNKHSNKHTGRLGEDLAAAYLQKAGYTILCRNFQRTYGEIDLSAQKAGVTYFVEVKTREQALLPPSVSVTAAKKKQIARMAQVWFAERHEETISSFLVMEVYLPSGQIVMIEDFLC